MRAGSSSGAQAALQARWWLDRVASGGGHGGVGGCMVGPSFKRVHIRLFELWRHPAHVVLDETQAHQIQHE